MTVEIYYFVILGHISKKKIAMLKNLFIHDERLINTFHLHGRGIK